MNSIGRFAILGSVLLAAMSMLMGWGKLLFFSVIGIQLQLTVLLLIWSYPVLVVLFGWRLSRRLGRFLAGAGIVLAIIALVTISNFHVWILDVDVDIGAWTFLIATLVLGAGLEAYCDGYSKAERAERHAMSFSFSRLIGRLRIAALWLVGRIQQYFIHDGKASETASERAPVSPLMDKLLMVWWVSLPLTLIVVPILLIVLIGATTGGT
jgi:hypothetical protein